MTRISFTPVTSSSPKFAGARLEPPPKSMPSHINAIYIEIALLLAELGQQLNNGNNHSVLRISDTFNDKRIFLLQRSPGQEDNQFILTYPGENANESYRITILRNASQLVTCRIEKIIDKVSHSLSPSTVVLITSEAALCEIAKIRNLLANPSNQIELLSSYPADDTSLRQG